MGDCSYVSLIDLPDGYWNIKNSIVTGSGGNSNDYWHRNDYSGPDWSSTGGGYSPSASQGTYSARFHNSNSDAQDNSQGALDLYINLSTGSGTNTLSFDYINTNGSDNVAIQVSTNAGGSFTTIGTVTNASSWTTSNFTFNSSSSTTVIRFLATADGESDNTSDIGIDNISVSYGPCAKPSAAPTGLSFGSITSNSISGSFNAASGSPNGYTVFYSTSSTAPTPVTGTNYTQAGSPYTIGGISYSVASYSGSGPYTFTTPATLNSNIKYYFYIFADNTGATCTTNYSTNSLQGNSCTSVVTPGFPSILVNSVTTNSINATLTASATGTATGYVVFYSTNTSATGPTGLTGTYTLGQQVVSGGFTYYVGYVGTTASNITVNGSGAGAITSNTNYILFPVEYTTATCSSTNTYSSGSPNFVTQYTCVSAPTGVSAGSLSTTTAQISWTPPNGTVTSYTLQYGTSATGPWTTIPGIPSSPYTLNPPLTAGTQYFVQVLAVNSNNTSTCSSSAYSAQASFYTNCTAPISQPSIAGTGSWSSTTTQISGSFTAASPAPTGYLVLYSVSNTDPSAYVTAGAPAGGYVNGNSYTLNGITYTATVVTSGTSFSTVSTLAGGTSYYFFVYSYSAGGCTNGPVYLTGTPPAVASFATLINTYYSGATGSLDQTGSWWSNSNGTGSNPPNFTTAGVTFNIINNPNPTIAANWTVSGSGSVVNVGNGASAINFTVPSGFIFSGTVNVLGNGTLTLQNSTLPTLGTLYSNSTVNFASSNSQTVPANSYYNLVSSSTGNRTIAGSNTINIAGTFTPFTNTWNVNTSTINFNGTGQTVPVFSYYNLSVTNASPSNTTTLAAGTINVANNFTDANKGIYSTSGNTMNFTGGAITIPNISPAYNNIIYNGTGTYGSPASFNGGVTINGTFTVSKGYLELDGAILFTHNINNLVINGSGQVDLCKGGSNFPATINLSGNFSQSGGNSGTPGFLSSNYTKNGIMYFTGSGNQQTFDCAFSNAVDFYLNSGAYVVLDGNVGMQGDYLGYPIFSYYPQSFTVSTGATLDCGIHQVTELNSGVHSSYFNLNQGAILEIGDPNGIVCATSSLTQQSGTTGNIQTSYRNFNSGATYVYKGTTSQHSGKFATTANPRIANLYVENNQGVTMDQIVTIDTSLNIGYVPASVTTITAVPSSFLSDGGYQISAAPNPAGVLNLGNVPYVNTVFSNASKLILGSNTSATVFPGFTTINIGAGTTVQYAAGVTQTVASGPAYYNLLFSGSSSKTPDGSLTAYGSLGISSGSLDVSAGNYDITLGGSWTNTGGNFVPGTGTVYFNGATGSATTQVESSTQNLVTNSSAFFNLVHNNNYKVLVNTNPVITTGAFSNSDGIFDAGGQAHTVTGTASVSGGEYDAGTGTQSFNGGLNVSGGLFSGSTGTVNSTDVNLSGGTLTAPSGPFNVSGNWTQGGTGVFNPGSYTVKFTLGSGTQTINSGGVPSSSFNNINHTGGGILKILSNDLVTGGTFTNSSGAGNFDANNLAHTVTGLATINAARYLARTGTQTFNGGLTVNTGAFFLGSSGVINQTGASNFLLVNGGTFNGASATINATNVTLSGGTLTATSGAFNVSGEWLNNGGTFTHNGGTVNFNGSALQHIGGSQACTFFDLVNNNASGLTVASSAGEFIDDNLNLAVAGANINTSNTYLLTLNASASATVYNADGNGVPQANSPFVNGPLQKVGNSDFIFPVGVAATGTGAVPIGISSSSGSSTDVFRAEYRHESAGLLFTYYNPLPNASLLLDHVSRCDYWTLNLISGNPTVNVTGYWNDNNLCLGQTLPNTPSHYVNNLLDIGLAHYDSTNLYWDAFGGYNGYGGNPTTATGTDQQGSVTLVGVSSFSPFALGSGTIDNPLPVLLVNFEAVLNPDKTVGLSWTTQQEVGMSHFEVERSADGQHWSSIGKVNARGNSAVPTDYVFTDQAPLSGANYYRIRMVNLDNISGLTRIRVVRILQVKGVSVYPVPARDFVNITVSGATVDLNIRLVNQLGQVMQVSQVKAGTSTTITLDVHNYAQGSYLLQVMGADGTQQTSKVVIMR